MSVCGRRSLSPRVWGAPGVLSGRLRGYGVLLARERGLVCAGRVDK